jgi:hypothetical protein
MRKAWYGWRFVADLELEQVERPKTREKNPTPSRGEVEISKWCRKLNPYARDAGLCRLSGYIWKMGESASVVLRPEKRGWKRNVFKNLERAISLQVYGTGLS